MDVHSGERRWGRRGRPPNDTWDQIFEPNLWVIITGAPEDIHNMDTDENKVSEADYRFNKLSPPTKYRLINNIAKPKEVSYSKNGSVHIQVTSTEAEQ